MSRTPLMSRLKTALTLARLSEQGGLSDAEALERFEAHREQRRRVLKGGAALLGAGALTACGAPAAPLDSGLALGGGGLQPQGLSASPVLVVGAGIAGLTAAYRLRQAGVAVQIHEASGRIGGRMLTQQSAFGSKAVELGGEFIDSGHTRLRGLAAELGLALRDVRLSDADLSSDLYDFGGRLIPEAEVLRAFRPLARRIERDLKGLNVDTVSYRTPGNGARLDRTSLAEYLEAADLPKFLYDLLDVAYTTEYGLEIAEQSALNLLYLIGTDPASFEIFGVSDERYTTAAGNGSIPQMLAQRLSSSLTLGSRLLALRQARGGSYTLSFQQGSRTVDVRADQVVLALPFTLLRQVELNLDLPRVKRLAIETLGYGSNAKLIAGFRERVWRSRARSNGPSSNGSVFSDQPYQQTWESSRTASSTGPAGALTNFRGGRQGLHLNEGSTEARITDWLRQSERVFPGLQAARDGNPGLRAHWPSNPYALGSYSAYRAGQWTGISGAEGEAVGGLHFAGEHTSSAAQGYMEGGCESGERVAREILAVVGKAAG
ncbi:flavin monoamine oxidase family protein [Deinococcus sp.]|uniref:flavin monoamine oxidase family protein n=1 Tax=Deinococcus sp. TaxID=47478 RepID=UPI003CC515DA